MLTQVFYEIDNFCKSQEKKSKLLTVTDAQLGRPKTMTASEVLTIIIYFHHSGYRNFKIYYQLLIQATLRPAFIKIVSYNRFIELMREYAWLLALFAISNQGKVTGISFIDSTPIAVCKNPRISSHKVLKGYAGRGKTSTGWFYGFKLHLVINHLGEIIAFVVTPGNVADSDEKTVKKLTKKLFGKLFGDRGYLSQKLFKDLWDRGIQLFTKIRKNMKNKLIDLYDKLMLRKRGIIESVNNILKSCLLLEHSRHRSITGFFVNIFSTIAAYSFRKKPSLATPEDIEVAQLIGC